MGEVESTNETLAYRPVPAVPEVTSCGISVAVGQCVIKGLLPRRHADPEVRERVQALCRPHDVVLAPEGPFRPLPLYRPGVIPAPRP